MAVWEGGVFGNEECLERRNVWEGGTFGKEEYLGRRSVREHDCLGRRNVWKEVFGRMAGWEGGEF